MTSNNLIIPTRLGDLLLEASHLVSPTILPMVKGPGGGQGRQMSLKRGCLSKTWYFPKICPSARFSAENEILVWDHFGVLRHVFFCMKPHHIISRWDTNPLTYPGASLGPHTENHVIIIGGHILDTRSFCLPRRSDDHLVAKHNLFECLHVLQMT